ncbi:hypothetical protein BDV26DRAFT_256136 [Aspergillus bertholletiae]|uniref:Uncharacterized protein n=1 Tax=Aspergillus bertholletiae TaxID=1226010 RepID=A0A5N7BHA7_9EURO|nr:hypothetical protein BDV26DRAFT_256136 [Aspergillus bertholletiae]
MNLSLFLPICHLSSTIMMDLRRPPHNPTLSPRHLALRHAKKRLRALDAAVQDEPAAIQPGYEQLYSYYVPGLAAGPHMIEVKQHVATKDEKQKLDPTRCHPFNVIGPRFSLPEGALSSFYPPQGHADRAEVLPNVVLNDPTLPWERVASWKQPKPPEGDSDRNRVPWLAVFVFTQEELRLGASDLDSVFRDARIQGFKKQSTTLSTTMFAKLVSKLGATNTSPVLYELADGDAKTDIIFLRQELFKSLFSQYDSKGKMVDSETGYVQHFRFLAHLRHINLESTPSAARTESDDHAYSVIVSHRIGTLSITKPTPVVAHLVNIEGVESTKFAPDKKFVAMSSLHSWEYTCLPPSSLNIEDAFEHLGNSLSVLKPNLTADDGQLLDVSHETDPNIKATKERLRKRIDDGFSLVRYRVQTGDITAAFTKSPFAPSAVPFPAGAQWPASSTTGSKLQILDPHLNLMDLTYSAAWNLGKALGLADPEFATALGRLRKQIHDSGMHEAQRQVINRRSKELGVPAIYKTKEEVLSTLSGTLKRLKTLSTDNAHQQLSDGMIRRWRCPELPPLDLSYKNPEIASIIDSCFQSITEKIASSVESDDIPYNELNVPKSTDWAIVLRWVLDRYHLVDVPPHYLITDPSHLPMETIRAFAIDHAWVCAMIDGGLSLANHLDPEDDKVRNAIKGAINNHLNTRMPDLYHPQTPRYGFYVRSALVAKFPDLILEIEDQHGTPPDPKDPPIILRHEVVERNTMIVLMREPPRDSALFLCLREPPHQQFFTAAAEVTAQEIRMEYKRVYTVSPIPDEHHNDPIPYTYSWQEPDAGPAIFIWGLKNSTRCLNVEVLAQNHFDTIKKTFEGNPDWFQEDKPTAALMGIQLNEPQWEIKINFPTSHDSSFKDLYSDYPRLLPIPAPVTPQRLLPYAKVENTIACDPYPPFGKRQRHEPIKAIYHPPHCRLPKLTSIPRHNLDTLDGGAGPQFKYGLYAVGHKESNDIPMLPPTAKNRRPQQDLIVSIVYQDSAFDYYMEYLEIHIELGTQNQLMEAYTGTGPSMLSNLRFNVLPKIVKDAQLRNWLVLTLRPRSTQNKVRVDTIDEMSFMLSGITVNQYDADKVVEVFSIEKYASNDAWKKTFEAYLKRV